MLKKLDLYILSQFLVILFLSIVGFLSIFLVVDLIENLDRFMDNNVPKNIILEYYVYSLPYFLSIGLPMSVLISTVLSLGNLVKRNEWTAMKASGISIYRVAIPLILSGFVLSGFSFLLDNKLVSHGNEKRFDIDRDYVKRKSRHKIKNTLKNLIFQKNLKTHISLTKYSVQKEKGYDLTLVDLGRETITKKELMQNKLTGKIKKRNGQSIIIPFGFLIKREKKKKFLLANKIRLLILVFFLRIYISKQGNQTNLIFSL